MKTIPRVVQLPGGVRLNGVLFRVTSFDDEGRAKTFEICPRGQAPGGKGEWILFADEYAIRAVVPEARR